MHKTILKHTAEVILGTMDTLRKELIPEWDIDSHRTEEECKNNFKQRQNTRQHKQLGKPHNQLTSKEFSL